MGAVLGDGDGTSGAPGLHAGGTIPSFIIPLVTPHPFRPDLPSLSTSLSHVQADSAQPSWQYPHGTKSHDAQLPGSEKVGTNVLGAAVCTTVGASEDGTLGASVSAMLVGAGVLLGDTLGA